jgi:hypothetical protein
MLVVHHELVLEVKQAGICILMEKMGLGNQHPKHLGAFDSKSLADQVSVRSMR